MKKHIIGLTLFSFIVVAAAIVYSMFSLPQVEEVPAPANYQHYSSKTSCWKMKSESSYASTPISQAVLDVRTRELNLELAASPKNAPLTAHLFVKNSKGTRYLGSAQGLSDGWEGKIINFNGSHLGLENLDSLENLYVFVELTADAKIYSKNNPPRFDSIKAAAITLNYGK